MVRIYSIATIDAPAKPIWHHKSVIALFQIVLQLFTDLLGLTALAFRQRRAMAAEILVLRRQIALYKERGIKPRRIDASLAADGSSLGDQAANFNVGCHPTREANTSSMSALKSRQAPFISADTRG